jgi:hypothetical protein
MWHDQGSGGRIMAAVRWWTWGIAAILGAGCVRPPPHPAEPRLPFLFEARTTRGEVRVVPAIQLHDDAVPDLASFVGRDLPDVQVATRIARAHQLDQLTTAVGLALPGEVNGELGAAWEGQFRQASYPLGAKARVAEALRTGREVDAVLGATAQAIGGDAVLVTWIGSIEARPLTRESMPGAVVATPAGPVVVDARDEPFLVSARVGLALVVADGEVVLRYEDTYDTVLSGARGPDAAGRDLAHALAAEVAKVWSVDPRLLDAPKVVTPKPRRSILARMNAAEAATTDNGSIGAGAR